MSQTDVQAATEHAALLEALLRCEPCVSSPQQPGGNTRWSYDAKKHAFEQLCVAYERIETEDEKHSIQTGGLELIYPMVTHIARGLPSWRSGMPLTGDSTPNQLLPAGERLGARGKIPHFFKISCLQRREGTEVQVDSIRDMTQ